ncbi:hypothetical protein OG384_04680 [Streptomyces sp. NBC_01324]|uniref:hypothetical protein n=1 Tax=Streptomyces sp. NBC_01324 TaxID=2903826 RepID=UPI002E0ECC28|nr:hypothetical protein OG384_04680 [Streptomyces sp. NBC_01324]
MSIIPSAAPNDTTPAPLSPEREAEIRTALDAVPAPPWRWIGSRDAGGPQLVTDHSGRQYLLRAAKPTDHRGDELLDPETDAVVYGDLEFRDQREGETYSSMRSGNSLAAGRTEYDPDAIVGVANPLARWFEKSAQHATELLAEVDRLKARIAELAAASPWERAVAGLNALVDADVAFWIEPDGHISGPFSDEHIEWDHDAARWVLTHDEDDDSHEAKVAEYLSTPYTDDTGPAETEALAAVDRSIAAQFPLLAALREGPHDADSKGVSS